MNDDIAISGAIAGIAALLVFAAAVSGPIFYRGLTPLLVAVGYVLWLGARAEPPD